MESCDRNATYTSYKSQNELLLRIKEYIQECIVKEVKDQVIGPYYGIQCDEMTDSSNVEQLGIVVRYVGPNNKPKERLLEFVQCDVTTVEAICQKLVDSLSGVGLDVKACRSQTMDGAGNMAGCHRVCAVLFRKEAPRTIYNYCCHVQGLSGKRGSTDARQC